MRKLVLGLLLAGSSVFCVSAPAATMYVSDQFTVPVRRGPSNSHRILHAGLPSGTALEVLGEDSAAGFTQVRMANGTEGWIPTQYLSAQPVARYRLAAADRRVDSLEAQLKTLRQSDGRANELVKQTDKLQTELAEVRRISATSIANYEENKQLKASNETLQKQVTQLTERVRQLERNVMLRWMLAGGGLVLLGLLLGAWIKSRPKRSSWS
ncbi:MAG: TIGR04211 family SH3 domain-containing protein [Steroidobacteraceae bacterium]